MDSIKKFFDKILEIFFSKIDVEPVRPTINDAATMNRNKKVLITAAKEIGVKEIPGPKSNPRVEEYLAWGGSVNNNLKLKDDTPWCAGFVGWVLEKSDMTSTNSLMARSYEKWGVSKKKDPMPGDIVTFWRTSLKSGFGHVGFFLKRSGDFVYVLGGNQSDEVNIARYSTARMTDIRRSSKQAAFSASEKQELLALADSVMAGKKIDDSGKVV